MAIGDVAELWRYPVKSLGGERLEHANIGDWDFSATGCGLFETSNATSRRRPGAFPRC